MFISFAIQTVLWQDLNSIYKSGKRMKRYQTVLCYI